VVPEDLQERVQEGLGAALGTQVAAWAEKGRGQPRAAGTYQSYDDCWYDSAEEEYYYRTLDPSDYL
jgi:hypothetical protein